MVEEGSILRRNPDGRSGTRERLSTTTLTCWPERNTRRSGPLCKPMARPAWRTCNGIPCGISSSMNLPGAGYPKEILELSYRDWTPETAELVRRHFLGPLLHDKRFNQMDLESLIWSIRSLRIFSAQEEQLMDLATSYSRYSEIKNSSTASPAAPAAAADPLLAPPSEATNS